MKLVSVHSPEGPRLAAMAGDDPSDGLIVFSDLAKTRKDAVLSLPLTLEELVFHENGIEEARPALESAIAFAHQHSLVRPLSDFNLAQLYLPRNILCVGRNYRAHAEESGDSIPTMPLFFAKWSGCAIGPGVPVQIPPDTAEVDYEAELAVIIGKTCRGVSSEDALHYVAGYTCLNDVSARDFQRLDGQWIRAKSQDTFGPFGPCLVTADQIPDPQSLSIRCTVNGRELQNSTTGLMIFPVRELIAFISRGVTLHPGDILSTGTPDGVGFAQSPPVFLKPGDTVSVQISGIGELTSPVIG
jgi:2-keto-4-pentenoate hydratase/2-oxohepta-3-ene-1,7-dioic acid hydratase in catechol pathway